MDDSWFGSQDEGDGGDDTVYMIAANVITFLALCYSRRICSGCFNCCRRRCSGCFNCCRRRQEPAGEDRSKTVPVIQHPHLQAKKRVSTSYMLLFIAGAVGAHHFYLERVAHGILAAWTFNLFGFGWLLDLLLIPCYVSKYNSTQTARDAPYDSSRVQVCCKIPLLFITAVLNAAIFFIFCPLFLNTLGVVDIHRLRAQTQVNPFDTLGISRKVNLSEARSAYIKESLRWHPDKNPGCGKKCDDKMSEITKAFDSIKRRRGAWHSELTWEEYFDKYFDDLVNDWEHIIEVFASRFSDKQKQQEKPKHKTKPHKARDPRDL